MKGYTAPTLPEEEAIIWGDDGGRVLPCIQYQIFGLLRRSMDRQTGIAGDHSNISYGGLYERLYQSNAQGVIGTGDAWGKTRDQRIAYIRQQVRQLEKTGLIKRLARGKKLVVEFSIFIQMRDQYFSVQNVSSGFAPVISSGFAPPKDSSKNKELEEKNADSIDVCSSANSGVCSTSPEVSIHTSKQDRGNSPALAERTSCFALQPEWQPSEQFTSRAKLCRHHYEIAGKDQALYELALADLRVYWAFDRPEEQRTQAQWEKALLDKMSYLQAQGQQAPAASPAKPKPAPKKQKQPFIKNSQEALRERNRQNVSGWIPPELREAAV